MQKYHVPRFFLPTNDTCDMCQGKGVMFVPCGYCGGTRNATYISEWRMKNDIDYWGCVHCRGRKGFYKNILNAIKSNSLNMKKKVGQVTPEEKKEIQTLFERRNGLNELAKILTADSADLYEKLVKDLGETNYKFQNWWDTMAQKYKWEAVENGNWEINFDTCEIFLVTPEN